MCNFTDKHLKGCIEKIDKGIEGIKKRHPGYERPKITSGLRGTRYYIEFPIVGRNVDVFTLILNIEAEIAAAKEK